jgi:hypothetical protein
MVVMVRARGPCVRACVRVSESEREGARRERERQRRTGRLSLSLAAGSPSLQCCARPAAGLTIRMRISFFAIKRERSFEIVSPMVAADVRTLQEGASLPSSSLLPRWGGCVCARASRSRCGGGVDAAGRRARSSVVACRVVVGRVACDVCGRGGGKERRGGGAAPLCVVDPRLLLRRPRPSRALPTPNGDWSH